MRKKVVPSLYDHSQVQSVHRNLTVSQNGRRRITTTTHVNLPTTRPPAVHYEPEQNEMYAYDDDHIPVQAQDEGCAVGVNVKVTARAKRYQNSVCTRFYYLVNFVTDDYRMSPWKRGFRFEMSTLMNVTAWRDEERRTWQSA